MPQDVIGSNVFAVTQEVVKSARIEDIDPALVGNDMRMLVSDMAGRASVELKGRELGFDLSGDKEVIGRVTDKVKEQVSAADDEIKKSLSASHPYKEWLARTQIQLEDLKPVEPRASPTPNGTLATWTPVVSMLAVNTSPDESAASDHCWAPVV